MLFQSMRNGFILRTSTYVKTLRSSFSLILSVDCSRNNRWYSDVKDVMRALMISKRPHQPLTGWITVMMGLTAILAACTPSSRPESVPSTQTTSRPTRRLTEAVSTPIATLEPTMRFETATQILKPAPSVTAPASTPRSGAVIITTPEGEAPVPSPIPQSLLRQIVADLANHLDVSVEAVQVVSIEPVTWKDSSLGCPEKGMAYLQVLTPGYQVILEVQGRQYDYRTDTQGNFRICTR